MLRIESLISEVGTFLFIRFQLESPLIMLLNFKKVKQFFENNFKKKQKIKKPAESRHFFLLKNLIYFLYQHKKNEFYRFIFFKIWRFVKKRRRFAATESAFLYKYNEKTTPRGGWILKAVHKAQFYHWIIFYIIQIFLDIFKFCFLTIFKFCFQSWVIFDRFTTNL